MPSPRSRRPFLLLALPALLIVVALVLFGVRAWVYGFLRSDDFRHFVDRKTSAALHADGRFQPFHWEDSEVYTDAFDATGTPASPFARLTVEQVRARLDLGALWHHAWRVESLDAEKFSATLNGPTPPAPDPEAASGVKPDARPDEGQGHGFLAGLLPGRFETGEVRVNDFSLAWDSGRVTGTRVTARPREGGPQAWEINGTGGTLDETHFPAVQLTSFNVKTSPHEVFVTRAEGQSDRGGRLEISGRQALDGDRALDLSANFDGLPIRDFLPEDWRARLHGDAAGTVRVTGSAADHDWHARGHVELKDGGLEAMPVLDELAVFTATARFRQIPLQRGRADYEWTPAGVTVSHLYVESEGLLRIEGGFDERGGQIDGTLQVGVARGSLRWVAGVGERVFNQPERDGYLWTTVRLRGPVKHPAEDLSPRLVAAAQQEVIDKAKQGAGTVLDTASSLLDLLQVPLSPHGGPVEVHEGGNPSRRPLYSPPSARLRRCAAPPPSPWRENSSSVVRITAMAPSLPISFQLGATAVERMSAPS